MKFGAPRDTEHPELRQPLALEVWKSIVDSIDPGSKITYLTNGPLTNLAQIISSESAGSVIQVSYLLFFMQLFQFEHPENWLISIV